MRSSAIHRYLLLCAAMLLSSCGGGSSDAESPPRTAGNQFAVDLTEIRVLRVDNSEPVIIEGAANGTSVITLRD